MAKTYKKTVSGDLTNNYRNNHITPRGKFRLMRTHKGVNNGWYYNDMVAKKQVHFHNLKFKKKYQRPIVEIAYQSNPVVVNKEILRTQRVPSFVNANFVFRAFTVLLVMFILTSILFDNNVGANAVDKTISFAQIIAEWGKVSLSSFKSMVNLLNGSWVEVSIDTSNGFLSVIGNVFTNFFNTFKGFFQAVLNVLVCMFNIAGLLFKLIFQLLGLFFGV